MIVRLLVIAASTLGTFFIQKAVSGEDPGLPPLPDQVFRPRARRSPRPHLEVRPDAENTVQ